MKKFLLVLVILISSCAIRPKPVPQGTRVVDVAGNTHYYEAVYMTGSNYCLVHQKDELIEYMVGEKEIE